MGMLRYMGGGVYDRLTAPPHSCDTGGDCECLCSAIATYADECARHRHHVRWRSQELCRECILLSPAYFQSLKFQSLKFKCDLGAYSVAGHFS